MKIAAVVFDMDGVLCRYRIEKRLAHLATLCGKTADEIHAAIWRSGFEHLSDSGKLTAEAYLTGFGERMGVLLSREQWVAARRIAMEPDHEMLDLVQALARRTTVALLTNNGALLEETIEEAFPGLRPLFGERSFFAWRFGTAKPDPAIYRAVCQRLGTKPEETFFLDDAPENAEGARAAGLLGHHFTGIEALRGELARYGLP
jgi:HAD superfamily hydrolase (TIGR01509 family)